MTILHAGLNRPSRRALLTATSGAFLATALPVRPAMAQSVPWRIVAAGGAVTEILYALGADDRLVGVDSTSQFPARALAEKVDVGYLRALSAEGILSLRPDLVLAVEGAGPPGTMALLMEAGIPVRRIPEDLTEAGVAVRIRAVAGAVGLSAPGERLAGEVGGGFDALRNRRSRITRPRRVLFVLSLQNARSMVGGRGTTAAAMITLAGAVNAADGLDGYKLMSDEAILAAAPDVVLVMNRGGHSLTREVIFALPAFAASPAAAAGALVAMDGLYLLGFGPRAPAAAGDLMLAVYPELSEPRP